MGNIFTLKVKFDVAEIRQMAPDWAFARTNPAGKVKIHATGGGGPEANQELFIFQETNGDWNLNNYSTARLNADGAIW